MNLPSLTIIDISEDEMFIYDFVSGNLINVNILFKYQYIRDK